MPPPPPGWRVMEEKGRIVYLTCHPIVKIRSIAMMKEYQQKGWYLDVCAENLVFSWKRLKLDPLTSASSSQIVDGMERTENMERMGSMEGMGSMERMGRMERIGSLERKRSLDRMDHMEGMDNMQMMDNMETMEITEGFVDLSSKRKEMSSDSKEKIKLEKEKLKVIEAVKNLTIDAKKKVDHSDILANSARKLHTARSSYQTKTRISSDLNMLKAKLCTAKSEEELMKTLWENSPFKTKFKSLVNSELLEQLLHLCSLPNNPLTKFPMDVNRNIYSDIIDLGLDHAPDFLHLLVDLVVKLENPIMEKDTIKIAFLFAHICNSVNYKCNAMLKLRSASLKCNGLTNVGLDCHGRVGLTESARAFRNDRDFMASINDEVFKSYAETMMAQFTFDNLDIQVNHTLHHLTLNFLEFEQADTSALSTASKGFEEVKGFFSMDTVLMQSEQNKGLFEHYKDVAVCTLRRFIASEIPEFGWMASVSPKHYSHPNSSTSSRKSLIHVDKPMYLQETKNR